MERLHIKLLSTAPLSSITSIVLLIVRTVYSILYPLVTPRGESKYSASEITGVGMILFSVICYGFNSRHGSLHHQTRALLFKDKKEHLSKVFSFPFSRALTRILYMGTECM